MKLACSAFLAAALLCVPASLAAERFELPLLDEAASYDYVKGLDKASIIPLAAAAVWPASFALICDDGQAFPAALAYAESFALAFASKELLKMALPRDRPYAYGDGELDGELLDEADESFPSGHTTLAFCAATSFATLALGLAPDHPATPWLVAGGYGLALGTAGLRIASGCHFPSDVLAGALLGSGIGWLVTAANIRFGKLGEDAGRGAGKAASLGLSFGPSSLLVDISL